MKFVYLLTAAATLAACSPNLRVAPEVKAPEGEAVVARGKYLADNVLGCTECHSKRDWSQLGAPIVPGSEFGGGGLVFDEHLLMNGEEFPGTAQAPNISQHLEDGIGAWTDGEILRAFREGVNKDGDALFPFMPYTNYKNLSDEDALAVVAYLRTIPPKAGKTVETDLNFPLNFIVNSIPQPLEGPVSNPATDAVSRGKYLVVNGGCQDCHSPQERGEAVKGHEYSGGVVIQAAKYKEIGTVVTSNITPDPETGLGKVTKEQFVQMIREGKGKDGRPLNPIMPWYYMRAQTDEDLGAIWAYLQTLPPISKDTFKELEKYAKSE